MSLLELLISVGLVSVISAILFTIFASQNELTVQEQDNIEMQDSARIAADRLAFLFSHAGFGCSSFFDDGKSIQGRDAESGTSPVTINSVFWNIQNNATNITVPDSVVIVLGFKDVATVSTVDAGTNRITFTGIPSPTLSTTASLFKRYLNFYPNTRGNEVYTYGAGVNYTLDTVDAITPGAHAYLVVPIRIQIKNNTLQIQNFAYPPAAFPPAFPNYDWDSADNIENMQFEYSTDGLTWSSAAPATLGDIQAVRFSLLVRAKKRDPEYTNTHQYTMAGQALPLFNDNFRRTIVQRAVWVRNMQ